MSDFHYAISGTVSVPERLPHVHLPLVGALTVVKGAAILVRSGGVLVERRVWVKLAGQLVDAGA